MKIPLHNRIKRTGQKSINKLSQRAFDLLQAMAKAHQLYDKTRFSLNDVRKMHGFVGWREVRDLFYELESRNMGKTSVGGSDITFTAFIPTLQNIS